MVATSVNKLTSEPINYLQLKPCSSYSLTLVQDVAAQLDNEYIRTEAFSMPGLMTYWGRRSIKLLLITHLLSHHYSTLCVHPCGVYDATLCYEIYCSLSTMLLFIYGILYYIETYTHNPVVISLHTARAAFKERWGTFLLSI